MFNQGKLVHAQRHTHFKNEAGLLYRFTSQEQPRGNPQVSAQTGQKVSWSDEAMQDLRGKEFDATQLKDVLRERSDLIYKNGVGHVPPMLFDEWNCKMYDNVRPRLWRDPGEQHQDQN